MRFLGIASAISFTYGWKNSPPDRNRVSVTWPIRHFKPRRLASPVLAVSVGSWLFAMRSAWDVMVEPTPIA
ncbi:hypothetical protein D3C80_2144540 [compost metagenome]